MLRAAGTAWSGRIAVARQLTTIGRCAGTPGKMRALNVFLIDESHYFLDLPGYGYARVGKAQ